MPETRPVYLHLGLQKTGTSYLQGVLDGNAEKLAAQGLDLVPPTRREAFGLMLQVRERYNPQRDPASVATALERFESALAAAPGRRALVTQESLAASRPRQVRRLLDACGDREVHVILTVRDLARQLPSAWQQELKAGKAVRYDEFLERMGRDQQQRSTSHPWIQLDPPAVLARWADLLPPGRIHVVTLPPGGSPTSLLLERFCSVIGVDPLDLVPLQRASNTSLGRVQAEVLRRVNAELPAEVRRRQVYGDIGKRFFASRVLAPQRGRRITLPAEVRDWCESVADEQARAIAAAGYDVVGDLSDLRCREASFTGVPEEGEPTDSEEGEPTDTEVAAAAVTALAAILARRGETGRQPRARAAAGASGRGRVRAYGRWLSRALRRG